jgi:ABC-type glycerol-3-phosphate transport system substrate-binding protein
MNHKTLRRMLSGAFAMLLLLSGCGEQATTSASSAESSTEVTAQATEKAQIPQTTASPAEQTGFAYEAELRDLSDLSGMPEQLLLQGDRLLLELTQDTGERAILDLNTGETVAENILTAAVSGNALWYCQEAEDGLTLTSDGGESVLLGDSQGYYPYTMAVGGDGSFYLMDYSGVRVYSGDGKQVSDFSLGTATGLSLISLTNGRVLLSRRELSGDGTGAVALIDTESVGASLTEKTSVYWAYPGWEGAALLSDGMDLYALDPEMETMEAVLDWIDTDINPTAVTSVVSSSRETIYVLLSSEEGASLATLSQVAAQETQETQITLGLYTENEDALRTISAMTVAFNQSQEAFRVHLVNYNNYSDGETRLQADAASLDLILGDTALLEDTQLSDLSAFFDDEVGEETLLPWVRSGLEAQGTITGLPLYFQVSTLVGSADVLGDEPGWTLEDFAELTENHPEAVSLQYSTAYDVVETMLSGAGAYMTDYASLLQGAQAAPADDAALYDVEVNQEGESLSQLQEGSVLLRQVTISSFRDYQGALAAGLTLKGYPTDTGNGSVLIRSHESLMIPAGAAHPQEAWSFLKALLTGDTMCELSSAQGFPILEDAFLQMAQETMQGITYENEDGETVTAGSQVLFCGELLEVEPLSQEELEEIRSWLEGSCGFYQETSSELRSAARAALKTVLEEGASPETAAEEIQG